MEEEDATICVERQYTKILQAKGLYIAKEETKGRCLFSSKNFQEGSEVLANEPYVATLKQECVETYCHYCFKQPQKVMRCSRCKYAKYCSRFCQGKAWDVGHKEECIVLQEVAPRVPTPSMLLVWRLLFKRVKEQKTSSDALGHEFATYLNAHSNDFSERQKEEFGQIAALIKKYFAQDPDLPLGFVLQCLCVFSCNCLTINDSEMRPLGIGMYPVIALINHSCDPNCVAVFDGLRCIVRAIRPIAVDDEITISYIEIADETSVRQQELKDAFFFKCVCARCKALLPEASVDLEKMENEEEAERLRERALTHKKEGDLAKAIELMGRSLELRRKYLSRWHPLVLKTLNDLVNWHIDAQQWSEALTLGEELLAGYETNYPPNWPITGLQHAMVGKLHWYLQNTREAVRPLEKAIKVLSITHGGGHPLVKELANMLHEAEAELAYQQTTKKTM